MRKTFFLITLLSLSIICFGQDDTLKKPVLVLSFYGEAYHALSQKEFGNNTSEFYLYNHNTINKPAINLALIKANYTYKKFRSNFAIHVGTYVNSNYLDNGWQHFNELNVGYEISKNLWLDAGIMTSHIGVESAIGQDNYTVTRSIMAENSPYYENGIKLGYNLKNGSYFNIFALTGWQLIEPETGTSPSFGTQMFLQLNKELSLNWSTFLGKGNVGLCPYPSARQRIYNNIYLKYEKNKFGIIGSFDIGVQKREKQEVWHTASIVSKYNISDKFKIAARYEYFNDENGALGLRLSTAEPCNFFPKMNAYSLNFDFQVHKKIMLRTEGKILDDNNKSKILTTTLCLKF